jgi:hypothetical protein
MPPCEPLGQARRVCSVPAAVSSRSRVVT